MKKLVKIAYYNNYEDLRILSKLPADVIILAMEGRSGDVRLLKESDEEPLPFQALEGDDVALTSDGKHLVCYPDRNNLYEGNEDEFLDIYRVDGDDEEYIGVCYENCPNCGIDSELPNSLGVYRCTHCGEWIVNCSMCPLLEKSKCCGDENCPLCEEARNRNKREMNGE